MAIKLIVASTKQGVIGKEGKLPWRLPQDLKRFKALTLKNIVVMGRKTYESLGCKPLPDRQNWVLTKKNGHFVGTDGTRFFGSVDQVIEAYRMSLEKDPNNLKDLYVIGGAEIYKQFLPWVDCIEHTLIEAEFEGDTFLPMWNPDKFKQIQRLDYIEPFAYSFITLLREGPK